MNMRDILNILVESQAAPVKLYHITDNARFKLNPNYEPQDNAIALQDRSGHKGIYLAKSVETWVNGHGYIRAFVAEILCDPSVLAGNMLGRYGGEVFVPADQFDKLKVTRVIPIDAYAREEFGQHGWIEGSHGHEFDTGNKITAKNHEYPFRGWTFDGDTRTMPPDQVKKLRQHFAVGNKKRRAGG